MIEERGTFFWHGTSFFILHWPSMWLSEEERPGSIAGAGWEGAPWGRTTSVLGGRRRAGEHEWVQQGGSDSSGRAVSVGPGFGRETGGRREEV